VNKINSETPVKVMYQAGPVDFVSLLMQADIFVRAAISDGDSVSVREALHAGVKVIASDCSERPRGSSLFKTGDASDLAIKIDNAIKGEKIIYPQPDFSKNVFSLYLDN
jgi:glycosyltransferase involved in cell wall biosynthesis